MDDGNDNIFASGDSGPKSQPDGGGPKSPATDIGTEGRIDPALARDTSASGSIGGTTGDGTSGPANNTTGEQSGPAPRRRGRPPGSTNRAKSDTTEARNIRASFIEKVLYSIHTAVAAVAKAPEFEIDKDDAQKLGSAIAEVLKYHSVVMTPQQEAYALLIDAAANVYPPMFISYYVRKQMEAKQHQQRRAAPPPQRTQPPNGAVPAEPAANAGLPQGFDPFKIEIPEDDRKH